MIREDKSKDVSVYTIELEKKVSLPELKSIAKKFIKDDVKGIQDVMFQVPSAYPECPDLWWARITREGEKDFVRIMGTFPYQENVLKEYNPDLTKINSPVSFLSESKTFKKWYLYCPWQEMSFRLVKYKEDFFIETYRYNEQLGEHFDNDSILLDVYQVEVENRNDSVFYKIRKSCMSGLLSNYRFEIDTGRVFIELSDKNLEVNCNYNGIRKVTAKKYE